MSKERRKVLLPLLFFPIIIILWKAYIALFNVPDYLLPQPEVLLQTTIDLLVKGDMLYHCLLYTSPSPRDRTRSRMPSSA